MCTHTFQDVTLPNRSLFLLPQRNKAHLNALARHDKLGRDALGVIVNLDSHMAAVERAPVGALRRVEALCRG